jgi:hypothetical protein
MHFEHDGLLHNSIPIIVAAPGETDQEGPAVAARGCHRRSEHVRRSYSPADVSDPAADRPRPPHIKRSKLETFRRPLVLVLGHIPPSRSVIAMTDETSPM